MKVTLRRRIVGLESEDTFWRLVGATEIQSQQDFFDHLKKSDHLKLSIYRPDELTRELAGRTQRIEGVTFDRVSFSKTKINSIIFRKCQFINCQFIGTEVVACEFHDCEFVNTNTHKVSISETYVDPLSFRRCLDKRKHQNIGVHLYQVLMNNGRDTEQIEFERDAQFLFLRWKRYQDQYELRRRFEKANSKSNYLSAGKKLTIVIRRLLWEKLFGCGVRLRYFVGTVAFTLAIATVLNYVFRHELGLSADGVAINSWSEAFYFTTVSLTTLGYGDITPTTTLGRVFASIQSVFGFALFALLASMLFRRVAP